MADLNIPNLNIKPDKYIFKKKLNLRRKSKRRLFTESFFLFILSVLLVYINYLIPNKNLLLQNLPSTFNKSFLLLIDLFSYLYEIFLVIFIFVSSFASIILNNIIPNKNLLLQNLPSTFNKSFLLLIDLFSYLYEIFLVIFIIVSSFTALILMVGSFNRLFKVSKRKSKQIVYK